jgi:hypothetical protein
LFAEVGELVEAVAVAVEVEVQRTQLVNSPPMLWLVPLKRSLSITRQMHYLGGVNGSYAALVHRVSA